MQMESLRRYRLFLIVMVYIIMASIGVRFGFDQEISKEREIINSLFLGLFLTQICIVDGRIAGKPLSIFSYWLVLIFFGIAVPVCIIRAHGFKGVAIVLAHYLGFMLVLISFAFITWWFLFDLFSP